MIWFYSNEWIPHYRFRMMKYDSFDIYVRKNV